MEWETLAYEQPFSYLTFRGENPEDIRSELVLDNHLMPPFEAGTKAGRLVYYLDGQEIGDTAVIVTEGVERAGFIDYLQKIRIDEACRLLSETNEPICTIATKVGFLDGRYFSQLFRKLTLRTPSEYRNQQPGIHSIRAIPTEK